jgi:hypothetical protein
MSAEKKVITIKGEELLISKCRKFNKLYYKLGDVNIQNSGDCYLINGKCYREETGLIVYNYSLQEYVNLDNNLIHGVVNMVENNLIIGYFNNNTNYSKITDKNGKLYLIWDVNILRNNKEYREELSSGNFYHISKFPAYKFNLINFPKKDYKYNLPYDSKGIVGNNLENYNKNYNPKISESIKNYASLLENLSFGLEFETTKGFIPNRILNQYGLIPLRDGSISGIEYVTVPMEGEKGLQCTADILKVLKERTEYDDDTCSLHLHLGNVPRTKEFILAFFKIGMKIQDEMFQMFPLYKKYNYHIKNKNYSAPLSTFEILSQLDPVIDSRNIDENFGVLYKYLSMGQDFKSVGNSLDNVIAHPADVNGNQKWLIKPRYLLFNIIPLIFGNKQTIEFRIHTPTYEINKILPFIFMNALIVNFTIKNQTSILKNKNYLNQLSLSDILFNQIDNSSINNKCLFRDLMYDYIEKRKSHCERQILSGNILGTESDIPASTYINWVNNQENKKKNPYIFSDNLKGYDSNQLIIPKQKKSRKAFSVSFGTTWSASIYDELQKTTEADTIQGWNVVNKIETVGQIENLDPIPTPKTESSDNPF